MAAPLVGTAGVPGEVVSPQHPGRALGPYGKTRRFGMSWPSSTR